MVNGDVLSECEWRAVRLWRAMGYGTMLLRVVAGEPRAATAAPTIHLDKPMAEGVFDVLQEIAALSMARV